MPIAGSLSDYTTSRFGRRKGYIIAGATVDLVFIGGLSLIAMAQPEGWDGAALGSAPLLLTYALLFLGLQLSSNIAQGPYQGLVPDLVAEPQVGIASGLVGVMRTVGVVTGFVIMALGAANELWGAAFLLVGVVEIVLAILTFVFVDDGPPGQPRAGRSWTSIALSTWGLDLLRERSFLRMTLVRLLFLMGTGTFINISLLYVERVFAITDAGERTLLWLAAAGAGLAGTVLAAIPAARISDRTGRKPVVWAAALLAACGIGVLALAPSPPRRAPRRLLPGGRVGRLHRGRLGAHDRHHPARLSRSVHGHRQHRELDLGTARPRHRGPHHGCLLSGGRRPHRSPRGGRHRRARPGARVGRPRGRAPAPGPTRGRATSSEPVGEPVSR